MEDFLEEVVLGTEFSFKGELNVWGNSRVQVAHWQLSLINSWGAKSFLPSGGARRTVGQCPGAQLGFLLLSRGHRGSCPQSAGSHGGLSLC